MHLIKYRNTAARVGASPCSVPARRGFEMSYRMRKKAAALFRTYSEARQGKAGACAAGFGRNLGSEVIEVLSNRLAIIYLHSISPPQYPHNA